MINLEFEPVLENNAVNEEALVEPKKEMESNQTEIENIPIQTVTEPDMETVVISESIEKQESEDTSDETTIQEALQGEEEKMPETIAGDPKKEAVIWVKNADVYQKNMLILSDVSFSIQEGEMVYVVGKTGSGKSNLLKLLYGEVPVKNGEVTVAGYNMMKIKSKNIQQLRRKLGIVFQDFQLLYDRSVYENLKFVTKVTGWKDSVKRDERIEEVLTMVGLKTKGHKMPHQLSGGEQQRVCIARALVNDPEIILADEPTGNLDPETSYEIFKLFHEISKKGTSVMIATHNNFIINQLPSRVLHIEQGKVIE